MGHFIVALGSITSNRQKLTYVSILNKIVVIEEDFE